MLTQIFLKIRALNKFEPFRENYSTTMPPFLLPKLVKTLFYGVLCDIFGHSQVESFKSLLALITEKQYY